MRILFLGDIVGRSGRDLIQAELPGLRRTLDVDFCVANGENAAGGFGLTQKIAADLLAAGIDVITNGNHVWDQKELVGQIDQEPRLLRPGNMVRGMPGRGAGVYALPGGKRVLVLNVMGRLYMDSIDDPFAWLDDQLGKERLGGGVAAILVDVHAELTSEKNIIGHYLDGRVSCVIGTHTHVPTADARILAKGTAYQTDAGMCGDYDSVIGMKKETAVWRMVRKLPGEKLEASLGPGTLCGVLVETDDATGLARRIEPLRHGAHLAPAMPAARAEKLAPA